MKACGMCKIKWEAADDWFVVNQVKTHDVDKGLLKVFLCSVRCIREWTGSDPLGAPLGRLPA